MVFVIFYHFNTVIMLDIYVKHGPKLEVNVCKK